MKNSGRLLYGWMIGVSIALATSAALVSVGYEIQSAKTRMNQAVVFWEYELSSSLTAGDYRVATKLARSLQEAPVEAVALSIADRGMVSWLDGPPAGTRSVFIKVPIYHYGVRIGEFVARVPYSALLRHALLRPTFLLTLIVCICAVLAATAGPLLHYRKSLLRSVYTLRTWAHSRAEDTLVQAYREDREPLVVEILGLVREGVRREKELEKRAGDALRLEELSRQAAQVAHDIRSPLTALALLTQNLAGLQEDQRILVRLATQRINDIANVLQGKSQTVAKPGEVQAREEVCGLYGLLDGAVAEARIRFAGRHNVVLELDASLHNAFVRISRTEFLRLLSNLLNNAAEASPDGGNVMVSCSLGETIEVSVTDQGVGMPQHVLDKLGERGNTFGKEGGSGLGLWHAKNTLEQAGGALRVGYQSKGTCLSLLLPRASAPPWHVDKLLFEVGATIHVIDDDEAIHEVWRQRFRQAFGDAEYRLTHSSGAESSMQLAGADLILVDYELAGRRENGLDLARNLPRDKTILVTSYAEDNAVQSACTGLGLRLLPKRCAAIVPLHLCGAGRYDVVLVDDDYVMHCAWRSSARASGKNVLALLSPDEFWRQSGALDFHTPVYVDYELGGACAETFVVDLLNRGFSRVFWCSGHTADRLPLMDRVSGAVQKTPPWVDVD